MSDQTLHDSGERRQFKSGAVRDRGTLKPRPDLISPHAMLREGMILALGAEKYGLRNYEKGMPISECLASALRHTEQYKRGDTDEDHAAQARTNWGFIIHYEEEIKAGRLPAELDDMPHYARPPEQQPFVKRVDYLPPVCQSCGIALLPTDPAGFCPLCIYKDDGSKPPKSNYEFPVGSSLTHPTVAEEEAPEPPTFYIAGPMTGIKDYNFPAFDAAAKTAREQGFNIINPAELDREHGIDPVADPECVDRAQKADPNWIQTVFQRDIEVIIGLNKDRGDGLILLPGWANSTGARAEVGVALWLGLSFKVFIYGINVYNESSDRVKRNLYSSESI